MALETLNDIQEQIAFAFQEQPQCFENSTSSITQFANTKGIYVLRTENGRQQKMPVNYRQLIKGDSVDQNVMLKPGDTIVVP